MNKMKQMYKKYGPDLHLRDNDLQNWQGALTMFFNRGAITLQPYYVRVLSFLMVYKHMCISERIKE